MKEVCTIGCFSFLFLNGLKSLLVCLFVITEKKESNQRKIIQYHWILSKYCSFAQDSEQAYAFNDLDWILKMNMKALKKMPNEPFFGT